MLNKPPEFGGLTHKIRKIVFSCFRCPVFAFLVSRLKRYVERHYAQVAEKAIRGIVKHISPEGELLQTSFGTGMGHDLDFYRHIPLTSMPYGQAMAMLCLTEYLRNYF